MEGPREPAAGRNDLPWDDGKEEALQDLPPITDFPVLQVQKRLTAEQRRRQEQEEKRLAMELKKLYPPKNTVQQMTPEALLRTTQYLQLRLINPITILQAIEIMEATNYDYSTYHQCKFCPRLCIYHLVSYLFLLPVCVVLCTVTLLSSTPTRHTR